MVTMTNFTWRAIDYKFTFIKYYNTVSHSFHFFNIMRCIKYCFSFFFHLVNYYPKMLLLLVFISLLGSFKITKLGFPMMDNAKSRILCSPPDNLEANCSNFSSLNLVIFLKSSIEIVCL